MKGFKEQSGSTVKVKAKRQGVHIPKFKRDIVLDVGEHNKICSGKNYSEIVIKRKNQSPVIIHTVKITEIFNKFNK